MQLTHDGRWLTTTDGGNTITVWDTTAPDAPVHVQRVPYAAEAASYCPARNRCVRDFTSVYVCIWVCGGATVYMVYSCSSHSV